MGAKREPISYKGRSLGIVALISLQLLIGTVHFIFGLLLLTSEVSIFQTAVAYDVYTLAFSIATLFFSIYIWQGKRQGWVGTVSVSMFVIVADSLAVFNLPSIPGIPKFAAPTEIVYSLIIMAYLLQTNVRKKLSI